MDESCSLSLPSIFDIQVDTQANAHWRLRSVDSKSWEVVGIFASLSMVRCESMGVDFYDELDVTRTIQISYRSLPL